MRFIASLINTYARFTIRSSEFGQLRRVTVSTATSPAISPSPWPYASASASASTFARSQQSALQRISEHIRIPGPSRAPGFSFSLAASLSSYIRFRKPRPHRLLQRSSEPSLRCAFTILPPVSRCAVPRCPLCASTTRLRSRLQLEQQPDLGRELPEQPRTLASASSPGERALSSSAGSSLLCF